MLLLRPKLRRHRDRSPEEDYRWGYLAVLLLKVHRQGYPHAVLLALLLPTISPKEKRLSSCRPSTFHYRRKGAALLPCTPSEGKPPPFIQPENGRNRERRPYRYSLVPPEGKTDARLCRDPSLVARRRRETRRTGNVAHCRWRSRTARWMATPRRACCRSCFSARGGERRRKQGRLAD
nr:hypothetical protein Iba_chr03bCG5060 [Ipomoea batatas]